LSTLIFNFNFIFIYIYLNFIYNHTEEKAIKLIENVTLIKHVNLINTEFLAYSGRLLLTAAKFIKKEGSLNFKILYALCLSQFNEQQTDFKDIASKEIIQEMNCRFYCLTEKEMDYAYFIEKNI